MNIRPIGKLCIVIAWFQLIAVSIIAVMLFRIDWFTQVVYLVLWTAFTLFTVKNLTEIFTVQEPIQWTPGTPVHRDRELVE